MRGSLRPDRARTETNVRYALQQWCLSPVFSSSSSTLTPTWPISSSEIKAWPVLMSMPDTNDASACAHAIPVPNFSCRIHVQPVAAEHQMLVGRTAMSRQDGLCIMANICKLGMQMYTSTTPFIANADAALSKTKQHASMHSAGRTAAEQHLHRAGKGAVDHGGNDGNTSQPAGLQEMHSIQRGCHHRSLRHRLSRQASTDVNPAQYLFEQQVCQDQA